MSSLESEKTDGRPFAAFDIDGTLIRWQLYHATADKLARLGFIDEAAFKEIRAARMDWKNRTHPEAFKEYEAKLVQLYGNIITTLTVQQFNEAAKAVFDEYKDQVSIYTRGLISDLKEKGYLLFALSGSQTEIVSMIADYYGFDDFVGTTYVNDGEHFTGEVITPLGRKDKELERLIKKHRASRVGSIAIGDSTGDIPILESVENPIAFNPEAKLFDYAEERGWKVVLERKNKPYTLEYKDGQYVLVKTDKR
jgi:HAD superfamily hydrolase (TIGR01490 family)